MGYEENCTQNKLLFEALEINLRLKAIYAALSWDFAAIDIEILVIKVAIKDSLKSL